jgi:hypothetical protein
MAGTKIKHSARCLWLLLDLLFETKGCPLSYVIKLATHIVCTSSSLTSYQIPRLTGYQWTTRGMHWTEILDLFGVGHLHCSTQVFVGQILAMPISRETFSDDLVMKNC